MRVVVMGAAAALAAAVAGPAAAQLDAAKAKALMDKAGCAACHTVDKKGVGPAYQDVAKKYKGNAGAADMLVAKVRKGGQGVWGPIPMPPTPPDKIADADLKSLIGWVLAQ